MQEIHDYIGEDEKILDESERLNREALYAIYEKKEVDKLEEELEDEAEFNLDEAELLIDTLARENPEYLQVIKNLQLGTRSGKRGETYRGIVAYFRKGDVDGLYILNKDGAVISDFGKVLSELRCPVNEKPIPMTRDDKRSLYAGLRRLEAEFKKEYQSRVELESKKDPVINKTIQRLAHFRRETKEADDLALIDEISKVLNKGIPDEALRDLRRLERTKVEGKEYLKRLVDIYNLYRMGDLKSKEIVEPEYKPVELICCEVLK